ncbi:hypothetical protein C7M84_021299 [Penaeus vannamei]|uniref:Uncharacterized protein n=1 Tax=Penaeus vannamei TaxID=6689 RepID=A0A423S9Y1_PENVA|nr:hypothetical protein C7M84_021299 [Penaeus vannamei]
MSQPCVLSLSTLTPSQPSWPTTLPILKQPCVLSLSSLTTLCRFLSLLPPHKPCVLSLSLNIGLTTLCPLSYLALPPHKPCVLFPILATSSSNPCPFPILAPHNLCPFLSLHFLLTTLCPFPIRLKGMVALHNPVSFSYPLALPLTNPVFLSYGCTSSSQPCALFPPPCGATSPAPTLCPFPYLPVLLKPSMSFPAILCTSSLQRLVSSSIHVHLPREARCCRFPQSCTSSSQLCPFPTFCTLLTPVPTLPLHTLCLPTLTLSLSPTLCLSYPCHLSPQQPCVVFPLSLHSCLTPCVLSTILEHGLTTALLLTTLCLIPLALCLLTTLVSFPILCTSPMNKPVSFALSLTHGLLPPCVLVPILRTSLTPCVFPYS